MLEFDERNDELKCYEGAENNIDKTVNHPDHYNPGNIEVIDAIEDWNLGFNLGNVIKYIVRSKCKKGENEVEDLKKALWYLKRAIWRSGFHTDKNKFNPDEY